MSATDDATSGDGLPADEGGNPPGAESFLSRVSDAVAEGFKRGAASLGLGPDDDEHDDDEHDDGDDVTDDAPASSARSARAVEDDTERRVREVLGKVKTEEATEQRLADLEKKTTEPPPRKESRLSRAIWG